MFREPFPILYVADIQRSIRFYCEVFGFSIGYRWPIGGERCDYALLCLPPCGIGFRQTPVLLRQRRAHDHAELSWTLAAL